MSEPTAYELYRSGIDLLEKRDHHAAALPLRRARELEPSTGMVREALGRALFGSQRYREAAEEFGVLVELEPVNHFAQFCLGRALQLQGLHAEARPPLTMAALLQPDRADYRVYRDRTIAAIEGGAGAGATSSGADPGSGSPGGSTSRGRTSDQTTPMASDGTPSTGTVPGGESSSARRRSGEGPWGAPGVDVPAPDRSPDAGDTTAGARDSDDAGATTAGAQDPDDAGDHPEDLGGPPPRA